MHVLVIPASYPTVEHPARGCFYREQAHAIRQHGLRVGVIAPLFRSLRQWHGGRTHRTLGLQCLDDQGVQVVCCEKWARFSPLRSLHSRDWIATAVGLYRRYVGRYGRPDILHAHGALPAGRAAALIAHRTGTPYVLTEHSTAYARKTLRGWQLRLIRRVLAGASARIMVSPELGRVVEAHFAADAHPWEWIPNTVAPIFRPADDKRPAADTRPFRFLNVALLTEKKGHDVLLRALAKLRENDDRVELRIVGDGPIRHNLAALAARLGIEAQVTFTGTLDRQAVVAEMQSADGFVLPSHHETFGVVLIEALACGLPVVATRCGGPESIVEPQNGLLVPPNDVAALAEAMRQVRRSKARYAPQSLRRRCLQRFGPDAVAGRIAATYEQVLCEPVASQDGGLA